MSLVRVSPLLASLFLSACSGDSTTPDTDAGTGLSGEGAELFSEYCSRCHGDDGGGSIVGPDLNERVPGLTEADVTDIILSGSGRMDPIDEVNADEAAVIAGFVVDNFAGE